MKYASDASPAAERVDLKHDGKISVIGRQNIIEVCTDIDWSAM